MTIPEGWKETTLGEVLELQRGFDLPTNDRTKGKYPIMVSNGQDGTNNEYNVKGPGIVTGRSGTLGKVFFVKENFWPLNTTLWVKNFFGNDIKFAYYLLKTIPFEKFNTGSGVPTLNRNHVHPFPVLLPPFSEQKAIADVLSSFDNKIELLREENKTLEAIAQTIFKEWFVNFNFPNEEGKPYKTSGGKMIDSEIGPIPDGWRIGKYEDFAIVCTGKGIEEQDLCNDGIFQVLGANGEIGKTNKYLFDEDLILTGRVGTLGKIYFSKSKVWISDNVLISKPLKEEYYYFAYFQLKQMNFENLNRGSTQPLITQTDLKNVKIIFPNIILINWHAVISSLFTKTFTNNFQVQILSSLRDLLLPKLMKGEFRVNSFLNCLHEI